MFATKITIDNVEEILPDSKSIYSDVFHICGQSLQEALDLIRSDGYDDRSTWTLDQKTNDITVHYKDINGLRFFSARTKLPVNPSLGHSINWKNGDKMCDWNSNVKYSERVDMISENADIIHYGSNNLVVVKARQFLVGRLKRIVDGNFIIAAKSCTLESLPETGEAVRALIHLAFGRFRADQEDASSSIYDYVLCMELKGMMPLRLVNKVMGKLLLSDMENTRKNFIENHAEKKINT